MKKAHLLLVGTMLSSPAIAMDHCQSSSEDMNVRLCNYSPMQRYVINGVVGYPVNLSFGVAERIKRYDFAFTGVDKSGAPVPTWRGPAQKKDDQTPIAEDRFRTNLPIWPFQEGHSALVVITTTPGGDERSYQFDLTARKAGDCLLSESLSGCSGDFIMTSSVSFEYPADRAAEEAKAAQERKQAAVVAWQEHKAKKGEADGIARLKTDVFYGPRNWAYQAKADPKYRFLAPSEVSDNGELTEFQWPENVQEPSIDIIDPVTGEERVAPVWRHDGGMVILSGTAEWYRLHLGHDAVMDIHDLAWSPNRPDPGTGTSSPEVVRTITYRK